ncbi:hypothetical protein [Moraxella canis]|uniref:hypothetical protein n=1 Tax=Moraxella canis TaxID=90239 RepID=UPI001181255E|nr:hypothetical protein [Moraxella canis]
MALLFVTVDIITMVPLYGSYVFYDYLLGNSTKRDALGSTLAHHFVHVCKFFEYLAVAHFAKNKVF